eukprot:scaffold33083_cov129-Isochrysis_galbana.AAC.1
MASHSSMLLHFRSLALKPPEGGALPLIRAEAGCNGKSGAPAAVSPRPSNPRRVRGCGRSCQPLTPDVMLNTMRQQRRASNIGRRSSVAGDH